MTDTLDPQQYIVACLDKDTSVASVDGLTFRVVTAVDGLELGSYVRSGDRLYIITGKPNPDEIRLWPNIPLEVGAPISAARTIRARSSNVPQMPHTPHWYGPWAWQFIEAI